MVVKYHKVQIKEGLRMFKKILSVLLLPLFALTLLVGCDKTRTVDDIKNYYETMKAKYIVETKGENNSTSTSSKLFLKIVGENDTGKSKFKDAITIQYDIPELNSEYKNTSNSLECRYTALTQIQQPLLDAIFNYYEKWKDNFYTGIKLVNSKHLNDDLTRIYDKLVALDEELGRFNSSLTKFERDVNVLGFEDVNRSVITTYTLSVNKLIRASYDFVNTFKDVHKKYIYRDNKYSFKDGVGTIDTLNRVVDEAKLQLAYVQYLQLNALSDSECDLSALTKTLLSARSGDSINNNDFVYNFNKSTESGIQTNEEIIKKYVNAKGQQTDYSGRVFTDDEIKNWEQGKSTNEQEYITRMNYCIDIFDQKLQVVNNLIPQMDMYKYYRVVYEQDTSITLDAYRESLSSINKANLYAYERFVNETVQNYMAQISEMCNSEESKIYKVSQSTVGVKAE